MRAFNYYKYNFVGKTTENATMPILHKAKEIAIIPLKRIRSYTIENSIDLVFVIGNMLDKDLVSSCRVKSISHYQEIKATIKNKTSHVVLKKKKLPGKTLEWKDEPQELKYFSYNQLKKSAKLNNNVYRGKLYGTIELHSCATKVDCPQCDGTGKCANCHGDTQITCTVCEGNIDCIQCDGTGIYTCRNCEGKGDCPKCDNGKVCCRNCEGKGICPKCDNGMVCCSNCEGDGDCPECDEGWVECDDCDGSGEYRTSCNRCGGSGYYDLWNGKKCYACDGSGEYTTKCRNCNGKGGWDCEDCDGTGECSYCDGEGSVMCKICGGSYKCSHCHGKGNFKCKACDGSYKCSHCHGKGGLKCKACSGSGKCGKCKGGGLIWCPDCYGKGKCLDCKGDKLITCTRCNGKGCFQSFSEYTFSDERQTTKELCTFPIEQEHFKSMEGECCYRGVIYDFFAQRTNIYDVDSALQSLDGIGVQSVKEWIAIENNSAFDQNKINDDYLNTYLELYKVPVTKLVLVCNSKDYTIWIVGNNRIVFYDDLPSHYARLCGKIGKWFGQT